MSKRISLLLAWCLTRTVLWTYLASRLLVVLTEISWILFARRYFQLYPHFSYLIFQNAKTWCMIFSTILASVWPVVLRAYLHCFFLAVALIRCSMNFTWRGVSPGLFAREYDSVAHNRSQKTPLAISFSYIFNLLYTWYSCNCFIFECILFCRKNMRLESYWDCCLITPI